jgi:hypothetical protein
MRMGANNGTLERNETIDLACEELPIAIRRLNDMILYRVTKICKFLEKR